MRVNYRNLNPTNKVTGSCHYLEILSDDKREKDLKIIIDYGATQDNTLSFSELYDINGKTPLVDFSDIDYICLTHFHNDHGGNFGRLPALDFKGRILTTQLTAELVAINLRDSAYLHAMEIESQNKNKRRKNSKNQFVPFFTSASVENVLLMMQGYSYYQEVKLSNNVTLKFIPAGHVSGASMIELIIIEEDNTKKLLFTGDFSGFREIPFTMIPKFDNLNYHAIFTESTYGNRLIEEGNTVEELYDYIKDTCVLRKGTLFIPSFAMSRSTNIDYFLKLAYEKYPDINDIPIYMASPMMCKSHRTLGKDSSFEFYDDKWKDQKDLFSWNKVNYIESFEKVQNELVTDIPKIAIVSSGMLVSGYANYLLKEYLPNRKNTLLMCGYTAEGTPSRVIHDGIQKTITIEDRGEKFKVPIRAKTGMLKGMSSHCDYEDAIEMFSTFEKKKLKKIILTHGDDEAKSFFKQELEKHFNSEIIIPKYGDKIKII